MILNRKYYFHRNLVTTLFIMLRQIFFLFSATFVKNRDEIFFHNSKGPPLLTIHPDQTLVCTSCFRCQEICPTNCIAIESRDEKQAPYSFVINMKSCIYCGLCEEVCPDQAIYMAKEIVPIFNEESDWIWDIEKLAFRDSLNRGKGIVLKDGKPQFQTPKSNDDPAQTTE